MHFARTFLCTSDAAQERDDRNSRPASEEAITMITKVLYGYRKVNGDVEIDPDAAE